MRPRWVLPPTEKTRIDALFSVDRAGSPVLAFGAQWNESYLLHPEKNYMVAVRTGVSAMAHLPGGALLLASGNDLVLPAEPRDKILDKKGVPYAALQPVTETPLRGIARLAIDGATVYCAGVDATSGRHAVYRLRSLEGAGLFDRERVYESGDPITAIAATAETLYVAKGRRVARYSIAEGVETPFYTHPASPVTDLATGPAGLLVSTGMELVLAGPNGTLEIMRTPSMHRTVMAGDTLYVLFRSSLGVLALDNLADLRRFNLALGPRSTADAPLPLKVSDVRFFESDSLENRAGFAESFERKGVRRIVARIEFDPASRDRDGRTITVSWFEPTGGRLASRAYPADDPVLLAAIGGESGGYMPQHQLEGEGGTSYRFGDDALGTRYPGRYRVRVQVDGIPAGEWAFTLTGTPSPWETVFYNDATRLAVLLDEGLDPRTSSETGESLLAAAVRYGSAKTVALLLERGADPNAADREGHPPLAAAEYARDWRDKAELLIRDGADVNAARWTGGLPLVSSYSSDFVALLLGKGADYRFPAATVGARSVLDDLTESRCTDDIFTLLRQRGADFNEIGSAYGNYSPIGRAISLGHEQCVQLLLEHGASTALVQQEPNRPPRSALYVALRGFHETKEARDRIALRRIIGMLLEKGATLRPGKKLATTAFFDKSGEDITAALEEQRSIAESEGGIMFLGENPSFFEPTDLVRVLEQDDSALEAATDSPDPAIREMALAAHLGRVRELMARARGPHDIGVWAHQHCEKAFSLSEAAYGPLQLDIVPETTAGGSGKPQLGIQLLKRAQGGAYVQAVAPGGAAERAGLKAGDIILALDTRKMKHVEDIVAAVAGLQPAMPVRVTFLRDDPMRLPELQLTCGLAETEYRDLMGYARMNLSRWLEARPGHPASGEVQKRLGH